MSEIKVNSQAIKKLKGKRLTIVRNAAAIAGAIIMGLSLPGCGKKVTVPDTASAVSYEYSGETSIFKGQEYIEAHDPSNSYVVNEYNGISYDNGINTSDLFFIRINGKVYLATKLTDINEDNIISKYYAIDTGEFLGQTLDINWYARATKRIATIKADKCNTKTEYKFFVDNDLKDKNYFNGEYGLGKNLCRESIISATSILSESVLTKEQIDTLLTDSLLTDILVEKYDYPDSEIYSREDYTFILLRCSHTFGISTYGYTVAFNGETSTYSNKMCLFVIGDGDNTRNIIGYRSSTNINDIGFNCVYDIESSSYLDLSQLNILDVIEIDYPKTVDKIRQILGMHYSIDKLKVVSTENLEGNDAFEKYYIAMFSGDYNPLTEFNYQILGEKDPFYLYSNLDGSTLHFCGFSEQGALYATTASNYDGKMDYLRECLTRNGLSSYIKDVYTEEELSLLLAKLRNKYLVFETSINDKLGYYKKISIKDIVVVDTSKENGDLTVNEGEQRYYILIPCDGPVSTIKYYETWDHSRYAQIIPNGVRIESLSKIYYSVLNPDGEIDCIFSLEDILREKGLDEHIAEEYARIYLQTLECKLNEEQKTLILN